MARKNQRAAQPQEALKAPASPGQVARAAELRQAISALRNGPPEAPRTPREFTDDAARKATPAVPKKRPRAPVKKAP